MLRVVKNLKRYIEIRSCYSKTVNELKKLSDRDLADLGIHRSNIENVARRAAMQRNFS